MSAILIGLGFPALAYLFRLPWRVALLGVVGYWATGLLAHLILPGHHPINLWFGGSWQSWAATGVFVGLAGLYYFGLRWLRKSGAKAEEAGPAVAFSPTELDRYARHIVLREVGGTGQKRLKAARVLVVGAGGLGSPALLYLAAAGVGTIGIIDDDLVSNSNLQRQIIHTDDRIGQSKVASAKRAMNALNPYISVVVFDERLEEGRAAALFPTFDLILDGSDNFDTRYMVNRMAIAAGKPLIAAAISQWEGQISLYDPASGGPCYACLFPERPAEGLAPSCSEAGVIAPLPGVLGAMMALEAVKHLTGAGQTLRGRLMIYDGLCAEVRVIAAIRRQDCPVCGAGQ